MQNRKTSVCARLINYLCYWGSVACAVLGPRVLYAHQASDAVRLPQLDEVWQPVSSSAGQIVQLAYDDEVLYGGVMACDSVLRLDEPIGSARTAGYADGSHQGTEDAPHGFR